MQASDTHEVWTPRQGETAPAPSPAHRVNRTNIEPQCHSTVLTYGTPPTNDWQGATPYQLWPPDHGHSTKLDQPTPPERGPALWLVPLTGVPGQLGLLMLSNSSWKDDTLAVPGDGAMPTGVCGRLTLSYGTNTHKVYTNSLWQIQDSERKEKKNNNYWDPNIVPETCSFHLRMCGRQASLYNEL